MTSFAVLRSLDDLARARREFGVFFSMVHRQRPSAWHAESFLGIWMNARMLDSAPSCFSQQTGQAGAWRQRVVQNTSLAGIWTIYCLQPNDGDTAIEPRRQLLECMIAECGAEGQFVPVFSHNTDHALAVSESARLQEAYPGRVLPPLHLDAARGLLVHLRVVAPAGATTRTHVCHMSSKGANN